MLSWKEPSRPNGVIVGYYLYFEFPRGSKKITDNRIISESRPHMTYNITGLGEWFDFSVHASPQECKCDKYIERKMWKTQGAWY